MWQWQWALLCIILDCARVFVVDHVFLCVFLYLFFFSFFMLNAFRKMRIQTDSNNVSKANCLCLPFSKYSTNLQSMKHQVSLNWTLHEFVLFFFFFFVFRSFCFANALECYVISFWLSKGRNIRQLDVRSNPHLRKLRK